MDNIKRDAIKQWLQADLPAADVKWSLFFAAVQSYRHDTVLRPFPPAFQKGEEPHRIKDHGRLAKVCSQVPDLQTALGRLQSLNHEEVDLLHWLLQPRTVTLKTCPKQKLSEIQALTGQVGPAPTPNYIFEVEYNDAQQHKFQELRGERGVFYAYHGSRAENFHSILHNGLVHNMNKNGLYGEGTYLSAELSITMPYAPCGSGWSRSLLGDSLSCVAVCEIIDDQSVKCLMKDAENNVQKNRSHIKDSMGGAVPEKYYVVRNDEVLRVKYLLLYADRRAKARTSSRWHWVSKHRFALIMVLYIVILVIIGLCSSNSFKNLIRRKFSR